MKLELDTDRHTLTLGAESDAKTIDLYSPEAFTVLSEQWLKVGWACKYSYSFTWMGRPIIQLPEDMIRVQEAVWEVRPDVIVETGVAHGGSLIFYAGLFTAMGQGRVIGVDVHIHPENRQAIEAHPLSGCITLIEGDSVAPSIVEQVKSLIQPNEKVMLILDSCHTRDHVLRELEAYGDIVTSGSFAVVTDGVMKDLCDVPGGQATWNEDNPTAAAAEFLQTHPEFVLESPPRPFREGPDLSDITHYPGGWLRRR